MLLTTGSSLHCWSIDLCSWKYSFSSQIASRAMRLGLPTPELYLLSETHADSLCQMVYQACAASRDTNLQREDDQPKQRPPSLLVIDSIQTMVCNAGGASAAGGITQVRECVALFLRLAKSARVPIVLVGHVTKSGGVAGPRTVEHMVDCVLYLEGPAQGGSMSNIRILRASKNRFGSSDEIGVYEMTRGRLLPVSDPSSLFLAHRATQEDMDGSATAIALEGRRGKKQTLPMKLLLHAKGLILALSGYSSQLSLLKCKHLSLSQAEEAATAGGLLMALPRLDCYF